MGLALIFPGQGSQKVGIGKDLAQSYTEARQVFEEVNDSLGQKLSKIIFDGPSNELMITENAQPALMAVSIAIIRILEIETDLKLDKDVKFLAGHSLGEYSALTAGKSLNIGDSAKILRARGVAMQNAVPVGEGAMAALIGVDLNVAEEIASKAAGSEICVAANDNAPGQVVLSGSANAIRRAIELGKDMGAKRSIMLPVSAPFHCDLMKPASKIMSDVLNEIEISVPLVPIVTNVTARPENDPKILKTLLVEQITSRVRWRESVLNMQSMGVKKFVEVGSGSVLTSMIKRIDRELVGVSFESKDDFNE